MISRGAAQYSWSCYRGPAKLPWGMPSRRALARASKCHSIGCDDQARSRARVPVTARQLLEHQSILSGFPGMGLLVSRFCKPKSCSGPGRQTKDAGPTRRWRTHKAIRKEFR